MTSEVIYVSHGSLWSIGTNVYLFKNVDKDLRDSSCGLRLKRGKTNNFQFSGEKSKYPNQIKFKGVPWSSRHYREYHLHLHSHEGEFAGRIYPGSRAMAFQRSQLLNNCEPWKGIYPWRCCQNITHVWRHLTNITSSNLENVLKRYILHDLSKTSSEKSDTYPLNHWGSVLRC